MNYDVLLNFRGLRQNNNVQNASSGSSSSSNTTNSGPPSGQGRSLRPTALGTRIPAPVVAGSSRGPSNTTNDEIKGKIMSIWNNMKFGLSGVRTRSSFSKENPVWMLGRCYHKKSTPVASVENSVLDFSDSLEGQIQEEPVAPIVYTGHLTSPVEEMGFDAIVDASPDSVSEDEGLDGFKRDFLSRFWMTYRKEFPTMSDSSFTSDCGWGCMIRSGQMLLAEGLVRHFLGRGWRWEPDFPNNTYEDNMHRKILRWFGDVQSRNSPFSIHTLVGLSKASGKKPGDWYGPGAVAHLLRQSFKLAAAENADLENITVYVAQDCAVYLQDIFDECVINERIVRAPWQKTESETSGTGDKSTKDKNTQWRSLILLVPLRLGTERLNQIYGDCLKAMLSLDYCIGIIGGRPKHSLYFVGYQEDKLINLDPHYCQDTVNVLDDGFDVTSFHCRSPRKMKLRSMDPSCCIGFYLRTRLEFERFVTNVQQFLLPCKNWMDKQQSGAREYCGPDTSYPMFVFCDGRSRDQDMSSMSRLYRPPPANPMSQSAYTTDHSDDDDGIEEFVII